MLQKVGSQSEDNKATTSPGYTNVCDKSTFVVAYTEIYAAIYHWDIASPISLDIISFHTFCCGSTNIFFPPQMLVRITLQFAFSFLGGI